MLENLEEFWFRKIMEKVGAILEKFETFYKVIITIIFK